MILALIVQVRKQVLDDVEPRELLAIGAHHGPRSQGGMGAREHLIARGAVVVPVFLRFGVDGAYLPLFEWVAAARGQALLLLSLADIKIVLE